MGKSKTYIRSPMNYVGGKYKLLPSIIPRIPRWIGKFVDLFCGGFNVGVNIQADTIYANDRITYLIDMYRFFQETPVNQLLEMIRAKIEEFGLSLTNKDGYLALRDEYNKTHHPLDLFVLSCYSFNHNIRFNNSFEFNASFGQNRSSYNNTIEENLVRFCRAIQEKNRRDIRFSALDFREFDCSVLQAGDMVYCDPPYMLSACVYNDGKRGFGNWNEEDDVALMDLLDVLNERGIWFAMSNVFMHRGETNNSLVEWSAKYYVSYLNQSYSNCVYNLKNRKNETVEVLITNYECWEE